MKRLILLLLLILLAVGCQSIQSTWSSENLLEWKYGDLRTLDPIDATEPTQDLIAVYTKINIYSFQMRIDFLDLNWVQGQDIYIPIDTSPGGNDRIITSGGTAYSVDIDWDYLIIIPYVGNLTVIDRQHMPVSGMGLLISRDTSQDNIVLRFVLKALPITSGITKIQVITTPPGKTTLADKIEPIIVDAPSPAPVKLFIVFWNTFSGRTPAESLRSWEGAHSGPMSSRHGLKYLIEAAARTKATVLLLDLPKPETLSALDYLNALPIIRELVNQGILVVPANLSDYGLRVNDMSVLSDAYFDYHEVGNIYNNTVSEESMNWFIIFIDKIIYNLFVSGNDYANKINISDCFSLDQHTDTSSYAFTYLSECVSVLVKQATSDPTTPLIIGGDFADSLLGDPSVSQAFFTYIRNHPWIQILSKDYIAGITDYSIIYPYPIDELLAMKSNRGKSMEIIDMQGTSQIDNSVYAELSQLPKNEISELAWQVYLSLYEAPTPDRKNLNENYIGQIGQMISAAKWADQPYRSASCDIDLDYDGKNECVLSNDEIYITIEPEGGYVPFIFSHDEHGAHQFVGPTWEFIVGISDPSLWDATKGLRSDPDQLLGAFSERIIGDKKYLLYIFDDMIMLNSVDLTMRKSITIKKNRIIFEAQNPPTEFASAIYIPLVLDPWLRFSPNWGDKYFSSPTTDKIIWGVRSGTSIELRSSNQISFYPFNTSREMMTSPENPNFDYPRGHYLPFPMALAEIQPSEQYTIEITVNP